MSSCGWASGDLLFVFGRDFCLFYTSAIRRYKGFTFINRFYERFDLKGFFSGSCGLIGTVASLNQVSAFIFSYSFSKAWLIVKLASGFVLISFFFWCFFAICFTLFVLIPLVRLYQ